MKDIIKQLNFETIWKIGVVVLLGAQLYLNSNYVRIETFKQSMKDNQSDHEAIKTVLVSIDKSLYLLQQNSEMIKQHEVQLKSNSIQLENLNTRMNYVETKL